MATADEPPPDAVCVTPKENELAPGVRAGSGRSEIVPAPHCHSGCRRVTRDAGTGADATAER